MATRVWVRNYCGAIAMAHKISVAIAFGVLM
jgi:hypothetical protein